MIHLPEREFVTNTKSVLIPFEHYEGEYRSILGLNIAVNQSKAIEFTGSDGNKYSQLITVRGSNA